MRRDWILPLNSASRRICNGEWVATNAYCSCYLNMGISLFAPRGGKEAVSWAPGLDRRSCKQPASTALDSTRQADANTGVSWHKRGQLSSAVAHEPAKFADLYKVCGVSSVSPEHLFQPQKGGSGHGSVSGVCSAQAPQHREKPAHNTAMSRGQVPEFYGPFTLPEQPKEVGV